MVHREEKEGKMEIQKLEYFETENNFLDEIKNTCASCQGLQQHALSKYIDFSVATDTYILSSNLILKLASTIFYQILIFHQMITLQKLWKMFLISSKKFFSFSRYSNFCIWSSPLFSPVSHFFRSWSKKILKFMTSSTV